MNDISKLNFRIFADNTNVVASSPSIQDFEKLIKKELAKINEWCNSNRLYLNSGKTNHVHNVRSPNKKSGNKKV